MSDLVKFLVPASFVNARATLRPSELRYGLENSWLSSSDAVSVALHGCEHLPSVPAAYEEIALTLSDDLDRVSELICELDTGANELDDPSSVWLYLVLARIYESRDAYADPLQMVEMVFADFDYPQEVSGFVRFLPAAAGAATGVEAVYDRWHDYLVRRSAVYRDRI